MPPKDKDNDEINITYNMSGIPKGELELRKDLKSLLSGNSNRKVSSEISDCNTTINNTNNTIHITSDHTTPLPDNSLTIDPSTGIAGIVTTDDNSGVWTKTITTTSPYWITQGSAVISESDFEEEIHKRDDRIKELESTVDTLTEKLETLTKQVASILGGSNEVVDDNVNTEKLKQLFDGV